MAAGDGDLVEAGVRVGLEGLGGEVGGFDTGGGEVGPGGDPD